MWTIQCGCLCPENVDQTCLPTIYSGVCLDSVEVVILQGGLAIGEEARLRAVEAYWMLFLEAVLDSMVVVGHTEG